MNKKLEKKVSHSLSTKEYIWMAIVFLFFGLLYFQFRWQILEYDRFSALANAQLAVRQDVFTKRGTIYTQDGVVLAVDSPAWNVVLSVTNHVDQANFLVKQDEILSELASVLDIDAEEMSEIYNPNVLTYQVLYRGINKRQKDILEEKKLLGIYTEDSIKRLYPNGDLFSHVIGYIGTDSFGRPRGNYGIEGFFWGDIKGKEGATQQEKDLSGKAIISKQYRNVQFREGKNIVLTVNSGIQKKVEQILESGVREQRADAGSVVIMNPKTGEIIAMANYPDYDPNEFWKVRDVSVFRNGAVSGPYEYGSVQKPLTVAMALEEQKITEKHICNDTGRLKLDDKTIYNFNFARYGRITPMQTLQYSDNICAAEYGLLVGADRMYAYLRELGLGVSTGIGIHEEETSFIKAPDRWLSIDVATTSYGQAISATPLQFASAMSTLANGGVRMQPMLVKKIYNNEDEITITPTSVGRVFSEKTATMVAKMMEEATFTRADMARYKGVYSIAGKTGTAQVARSDTAGYYDDRVNVTYVGFAPAIDARFVMVVKIENPKEGTLANLTVLPLWMKIFDTIKDDLGVPRIN
ncbi:MAG: penicillin-binding protein 2 [Candidatus Dojkabacteria bacterium]|nr:MAG: penicillin-binding protein 2 [Candidatus Dojkabacteria bacterium]